MSKYIHADLLTQYAQISQTDNAPWGHFQYREYNDEEWSDCTGPVQFWFDHEYRLKPKTIRIGDIEVPEPVRRPLNLGEIGYIPDVTNGYPETLSFIWGFERSEYAKRLERLLLSFGVIHLDEKSATTHAKALISLTTKK